MSEKREPWIGQQTALSSKKLMPQVDKVTFFSQVFWLVLIFFLFYIIFYKKGTLHVKNVVKLRDKNKEHLFSKLVVFDKYNQFLNLKYSCFYNKLFFFLSKQVSTVLYLFSTWSYVCYRDSSKLTAKPSTTLNITKFLQSKQTVAWVLESK